MTRCIARVGCGQQWGIIDTNRVVVGLLLNSRPTNCTEKLQIILLIGYLIVCVCFAWVNSRTMAVNEVLPSNSFNSSVEIGMFLVFLQLLVDLSDQKVTITSLSSHKGPIFITAALLQQAKMKGDVANDLVSRHHHSQRAAD